MKTKKEWITLLLGSWTVFGVFFAAVTFMYKVYEIINTIPRGDVMGFAIVQVMTYLFVTIGFFFLFLWSFLKGDFTDLEGAKYFMLTKEEKTDRIEKRRN